MTNAGPEDHRAPTSTSTAASDPSRRAASRRRLSTLHPVDLLLLGVVTVWGVNFSVIKFALAEMSPLTFVGLRFSLASVTMLLLTRVIEGDVRVRRDDRRQVVLIGLIGHATFQFFFVLGLSYTRAGHSSLMLGLTPVFVALIGLGLRIEHVSARVWASILLSFVGVVLITTGGGGGSADAPTLLGDMLSMAATFFWATYTVLAQPLLRHYTPIKLTTVTMVPGTLVLLAAAIPAWVAQDWGQVTLAGWLALLYSSGLAIVGAYIVWYASVQRVGSARTAIFSNLVPVVALTAAWLLRGETLSPPQLAGAAIVLVGISLARR